MHMCSCVSLCSALPAPRMLLCVCLAVRAPSSVEVCVRLQAPCARVPASARLCAFVWSLCILRCGVEGSLISLFGTNLSWPGKGAGEAWRGSQFSLSKSSVLEEERRKWPKDSLAPRSNSHATQRRGGARAGVRRTRAEGAPPLHPSLEWEKQGNMGKKGSYERNTLGSVNFSFPP